MKHETKRLIAGAALLASLIAPGLAAAQQLEIVDAWARATPTGVETAAAYLKIENIGDADRLVAARSPVSREVQIHDTVRNGLFMRMVRLDALELPAASVGSAVFAKSGRAARLRDVPNPPLSHLTNSIRIHFGSVQPAACALTGMVNAPPSVVLGPYATASGSVMQALIAPLAMKRGPVYAYLS